MPQMVMNDLVDSRSCVFRVYYDCLSSCMKVPSEAQLRAWGERISPRDSVDGDLKGSSMWPEHECPQFIGLNTRNSPLI